MIRIRPGIVLTHVCDQCVLVAAREARPYCPYTTILNKTGEIIWKCLTEGKDLTGIIEHMTKEFDIPSGTDIKQIIMDYIDQLHVNGYVLYEEDIES